MATENEDREVSLPKNLTTFVLLNNTTLHIMIMRHLKKFMYLPITLTNVKLVVRHSLAQSLKKNIYVVHEGHKDHKCKSCGKSFSQPGNLKKHIHKIHKGHKDHKCVFCGKSFSLGQSLKRHIYTIHEDHKYHKCVSCGKSFSSARYLKH